jgi:hypothetical protein
MRLVSNKMMQLKQDIAEVKYAIEELEPYLTTGGLEEEYTTLKDRFGTLEENLKDHIEDVEIFIGRTS